jgi:GT2 family glycosyltransferase
MISGDDGIFVRHGGAMTGSAPAADATAAGGVSLIVPIGGDTSGVERCLASVSRLAPPPAELIAVLDGDFPEIQKAAEAMGARIVARPVSGGPAVARNQGAAAARGAILFFADADVELAADAVERVVAFFDANPGYGALFGSYDAEPAEPDFHSQYRNLLHHYVHQRASPDASTFWAGCGAVRRDVFEAVGGFDEDYPVPCIEDIELGYRMRRAGCAIRLVKDLQVKHLKRWRPRNMLATDLFRRAVPWTRLMLREGRLLNDLNVKTNDRLSVVLVFLLAAAIAAAAVWPPLLGAAAAIAILVLVFNRDLYGFYRRRRGAWFAARSVAWHWLYLVVCGLGFGIGTARHLVARR